MFGKILLSIAMASILTAGSPLAANAMPLGFAARNSVMQSMTQPQSFAIESFVQGLRENVVKANDALLVNGYNLAKFLPW